MRSLENLHIFSFPPPSSTRNLRAYCQRSQQSSTITKTKIYKEEQLLSSIIAVTTKTNDDDEEEEDDENNDNGIALYSWY